MIMLITSSQILCDKYDVLQCPLFPYFFYMSWEEWITLGQKLNYTQKVSIMA